MAKDRSVKDWGRSDTQGVECEFCAKLYETSPRDDFDFHILKDREYSQSAVAVAALGPITVGHTIIVSRRHVTSVADLPTQEYHEFRALAERVASVLTPLTDDSRRVVMFENGSRSDPDRSGCGCIDHAHWNVLATRAFSPGFVNVTTLMSTGAEIDLSPLAGTDYFLWIEPGLAFASVLNQRISQAARRHIAAAEGLEEEWDYLAFPRVSGVYKTIRLLEEGLPTIGQ